MALIDGLGLFVGEFVLLGEGLDGTVVVCPAALELLEEGLFAVVVLVIVGTGAVLLTPAKI